jgi:nucleotide-binding universal stress UspA family protein
MFHRILLAWPPDPPPPLASLRVARSLAEVYDADLTVCCLADGMVEAQAAAGTDAFVTSLPTGDTDRELLRYAHEHAFDLVVIGRATENEQLPRRVIDWASLPVLVVAEEWGGRRTARR